MNCKPGDFARVVCPGIPSVNGLIVLVVKPHPRHGLQDETWWVEPALPWPWHDREQHGCVDWCLRPISPSDGEDEMLRIAGKPNETPREIIRELAK